MSKRIRSERGTPPGSKGARRATEGTGGGLLPGQRWSAGRKREVVLRMLRGESLDALSRELGVEIYRLEQWRDKALSGLDAGLKDRQDDPLSHELDAAKRHIGELSYDPGAHSSGSAGGSTNAGRRRARFRDHHHHRHRHRHRQGEVSARAREAGSPSWTVNTVSAAVLPQIHQ